MTHKFRFFGQSFPSGTILTVGDHWYLSDDDAFHAIKVLRLQNGDSVEVMNGLGFVATGSLSIESSKKAFIKIEKCSVTKSAAYRRGIAVGALKPQNCDEIIPSLVELGVTDIHIFLQEGTAKLRVSEAVLERWNRIIAASVKQCKAAFSPQLHVHSSVPELMQALSVYQRRLRCDADGMQWSHGLSSAHTNVVMVVGSEKGFTDSEVRLFNEAGYQTLSIGAQILRATTAAVAAAVILNQL
jgi:16S rRNA (uracil1498-N3)-methyltransferase